jgi:hypothetical protein
VILSGGHGTWKIFGMMEVVISVVRLNGKLELAEIILNGLKLNKHLKLADDVFIRGVIRKIGDQILIGRTMDSLIAVTDRTIPPSKVPDNRVSNRIVNVHENYDNINDIRQHLSGFFKNQLSVSVPKK